MGRAFNVLGILGEGKVISLKMEEEINIDYFEIKEAN